MIHRSALFPVLGLCFLLTSCVEKLVYLPFPTNFTVILDINVDSNNAFDVQETLTSLDIANEIRNQLDGQFDLEEIQQTEIEGMSYSIIETEQQHAAINGFFRLGYAGSNEETLFELNNLILGDAVDKTEVISLGSSGVTLLNLALNDIISGNTNSIVTVHAVGQAFPQVTRFTIRLDFVATPVIEQRIEIFDPF